MMSNVLTIPKPRRPRTTRAIRKVVELLASGKASQQVDAARAAGLTPEHVSRTLRRPEVQELLRRRTGEILSAGQIRAAVRLHELCDSDSSHTSLDAAKHLLAVNGFRATDAPTGINNAGIIAGYVIDLGDGNAVAPAAPPIIDVTPEGAP